jgi:hypothetical protein
MSVRAYRINKIELKDNNTFNLWHESKFMNELQNAGYLNSLNESGGGQIELPVDYIKKILKKKDIFEDEHVKNELKDDIKFAEQLGDDYILYECY